MHITVNLATRPFADFGPAMKHLRIAMGVLALAVICMGLGLHALHRKAEEARDRVHSLDGQIASITQERQGYQNMMHEPANAELLTEVETLNQLFDQKAFSWTLAMEDLETVLPGGVQVTTIEPIREKDGHITIRLRVIGPRDRAVDLVRNLEHSRRFLLPRIVGENAESNGGPGEKLQPVSASNRFDFDLLAEYNPATSVERRRSEKPSPASELPVSGPAPAHGAARSLHGPALIQAPQSIQPHYTGTSRPSMNRPISKPSPFPKPAKGAPGGPQ
jgi:type IV pilus assembly protein PilN